MVVSVCPAANVAATLEDVWELLAQPSNYDKWWDAHLERSVPEGPGVPGQISYATTKAFGKKWDVTLVVKSVNPDRHQIQIDATLPFGIIDHATITCTPVDAVSCRLQFGWDFTLPPGWMGWLIEHFGAGMLHKGVEDSLARLKRAAEALHIERDPSLRSGWQMGRMINGGGGQLITDRGGG